MQSSPHGYEVGSDLAEDLDRHISGYIAVRDLCEAGDRDKSQWTRYQRALLGSGGHTSPATHAAPGR